MWSRAEQEVVSSDSCSRNRLEYQGHLNRPTTDTQSTRVSCLNIDKYTSLFSLSLPLSVPPSPTLLPFLYLSLSLPLFFPFSTCLSLSYSPSLSLPVSLSPPILCSTSLTSPTLCMYHTVIFIQCKNNKLCPLSLPLCLLPSCGTRPPSHPSPTDTQRSRKSE